MTIPIVGLGGQTLSAGGYAVDNSIRFNDGDSPKLTRTFTETGGTRDSNGTTWTISMWVKRGVLGTAQPLWSRFQSSAYGTIGTFNSGDTLTFKQWNASSDTGNLTTNRVFRDCSAWYNIIFVWNSGDATAGNRMRLFINGVEETSFSTDTNPSEDLATTWATAHPMIIGNSESTYFDGYLAEIVFLDGTAVTDATSFGEYDEDSPTIWKPKDVSGLTFGTTGFYLDFEDSSSLGNDANGSNNWTPTNLAAVDQATDTPTNNFCTMNPLDNFFFGGTFSEGNCKTVSTSSGYSMITSTIGVSSGKWYVEAKVQAGYVQLKWGISSRPAKEANETMAFSGSTCYSGSNGALVLDTSTTVGWGANFSVGDILGCALDLDNNKIYFSVNGSWQSGGDPSAGSGGETIVAASTTSTGNYFFAWSDNKTDGGSTMEYNFGGSPAFTVSSGNADSDSHGNFEYAVPSGYFAICTKNLAEYG